MKKEDNERMKMKVMSMKSKENESVSESENVNEDDEKNRTENEDKFKTPDKDKNKQKLPEKTPYKNQKNQFIYDDYDQVDDEYYQENLQKYDVFLNKKINEKPNEGYSLTDRCKCSKKIYFSCL